jgi:hypothetical protein
MEVPALSSPRSSCPLQMEIWATLVMQGRRVEKGFSSFIASSLEACAGTETKQSAIMLNQRQNAVILALPTICSCLQCFLTPIHLN